MEKPPSPVPITTKTARELYMFEKVVTLLRITNEILLNYGCMTSATLQEKFPEIEQRKGTWSIVV